MIKSDFFNVNLKFVFNTSTIAIYRSEWTSIEPEDATISNAVKIMKENRYDVLPIESDKQNKIIECFYTNTINTWTEESVNRKKIKDDDILPIEVTFDDLIDRFNITNRLFFFLSSDGQIKALITRANLNERPIKAWLYTMLCALEMNLGKFIKSEKFTDEDILKQLTDDRKKKVYNNYEEDQELGVENNLVEYLYLSDLINICRKKKLYKKLKYSSATKFKELNTLNELRRQVMHPVSAIIDRKNTLRKLSKRIKIIKNVINRIYEYWEKV